MQAVILAGGEGCRLRPYTTILPKPLMPIDDKAILEIVLLQLKASGIKEFIFSVGYLSSLIESYFADGSRWGVRIRYSREKEPLGTAGPLTIIKGLAPKFIVMNGDILCDLKYADFIEKHLKGGDDITICSYSKAVKIDLGVLILAAKQLKDYIEKPEYSFQVSMGIYGMNRCVVEGMPKMKYCNFPDLIKDRLRCKAKIGIYYFSGKWYDIGNIGDYKIAQEEFMNNSKSFLNIQRKMRLR